MIWSILSIQMANLPLTWISNLIHLLESESLQSSFATVPRNFLAIVLSTITWLLVLVSLQWHWILSAELVAACSSFPNKDAFLERFVEVIVLEMWLIFPERLWSSSLMKTIGTLFVEGILYGLLIAMCTDLLLAVHIGNDWLHLVVDWCLRNKAGVNKRNCFLKFVTSLLDFNKLLALVDTLHHCILLPLGFV